MKRKSIALFLLLYMIYFIGLFMSIGVIIDVFTPVLGAIAFVYTFNLLFKKVGKINYKISTFFLSVGVLNWFLCDFVWGFELLILNGKPEDNLILTNFYSLTNLFLLLSIITFCYHEIKNKDKVQFLLDSTIITICVGILLWIFIFNQNIEKALLLKVDFISALSLISDVAMFVWISILYFSIRKGKIPKFLKFIVTGYLIFIVADFVYYYTYFYDNYSPDTMIDGGYVVALLFLTLGSILRKKSVEESFKVSDIGTERKKGFSKEWLLIFVPAVLVLFGHKDTDYLLFLVSSIMFYYVLTNYTQKNIFRDELLKREKEYIEILEARVEERTGEIVKLINTEAITGLYSRRYFEEYLLGTTKNVRKDERVILLYVEQNKFKMINAMYGKFISEKVLKELGARMNEVVSKEKWTLAAYGDDAFVLAVNGDYTYEHGRAMAEQIIQFCSDVYKIDHYEIDVSLNIGIACYPLDAKDSEELVRNADIAMVQSRAVGFNKTVIFNQQMGHSLYNRGLIEIGLKKVKCFDEEFFLCYQPQVLCKDGSFIGLEALVRWKTKGGKSIAPSDFIPIAEDIGVIIPLGYWIMEKAIAQLSEWNAASNQKIRMAINVSAKQLVDKDFISKFQELLNQYRINPCDVEIEITENKQLEQNVEMKKILDMISDMGVSIAVDDFGTGYSSLYYLKNLPIRRIKIAKELIDNIEQDWHDYAIVKAVISIGKTRGIQVIAEGVENSGQWESLKELECDEIQGYYFAKPMTVEELEQAWMKPRKLVNLD